MADFLNKLRRLKGNVLFYANNYRNKGYLDWYYNHRERLEQFKDIHKGESCFIIGNGPSLNKMDLTLLNGHYLFGLNKIYLLFDRVKLNLSYHVAVNDLVIQQSIDEFKQLDCPSFLSYIPALDNVHDYKHIYWIETGKNYGVPFSFCSNLFDPIHEGHTVTYVAMEIAFYMGFNNVFLVGVDHNFIVQGKPNEQQFLEGEDQNHFDPRYFGDKQWHLPDLVGSELAYHLAKFHYNRAGRQIFDATVDGKLQIFPKISFEQALTIATG